MALSFTSTLNLDGLTAEVLAAAPEALRTAMEHIREVAVELTPLEEGTLRRSATVHIHDTDIPTADITYDGPYARYQHEKLDLRHEVGQAKFLETALLAQSETAKQIIATALGQAL